MMTDSIIAVFFLSQGSLTLSCCFYQFENKGFSYIYLKGIQTIKIIIRTKAYQYWDRLIKNESNTQKSKQQKLEILYKRLQSIKVQKSDLTQNNKTEKIRSLFQSYLSQKKSNPSMIEKSLFQKRINQPTRKQISYDENNLQEDKNPKLLKDIFNSIQSEQNSIRYVDSKENSTQFIDFKLLFEQQHHINEELTQKINLLQQKIQLLEIQNKELKQKLRQSREQQCNQPSLTFITLKKKSHKQIFFEQIRSFKQNLPNSMKVIEFEQLDNFESLNFLTDEQIMSKNDVILSDQKQTALDQPHSLQKVQRLNSHQHKSIATSAVTLKLINDESLIDCMAVYGLSQETKLNQYEDDYVFEGELTYCSKAPHQIVKHSSKLVFPDKVSKSQMKYFIDEEAVENAVSLISQTLKSQEIKAFTLIFEPAMLPNEEDKDQDSEGQIQQTRQSEIINLINKQRRFYAISVAFDDFDLVQSNLGCRFPQLSFQNSLQQDIFNYNIHEIQTQQKDQQKAIQISNQNASISNKSNSKRQDQRQDTYQIRVSKKVVTFFTKYPFIQFFEELLVNCVKQSFESRKEEMKKNISELKNFDHTKTITFLKGFYQNLNKEYKLNQKFNSKLNEIFEIKFFSARLSRFESLSLQLSKTLLKNFYSQIWAYPVLRLFTLDNFLDVFTLIMLEEKVIFVCENQHILTSTIFLFTKVLIKPFDYPYPVVSIIPNEYDYFNTPFPIVYGCLNSKENLIRQKIPKIYKNTYIILTPNGIQIMQNKSSVKIQTKKSPKLRDKLLPCFIKMQNQQKQWNQQKMSSTPRFSKLSSLLGLNASTISSQSQNLAKNKFNFSNNNRQISFQIIQKVSHYLSSIKDKLPSKKQVKELKQVVQKEINELNLPENKGIDLDKQTYERIKRKLQKKTSDPFVQRFLQTQIVGMEILK